MKHLVFLLIVALSFPVVAQDQKPPAKKAAKKAPAKKKAEPKATSQEWGNFSKQGDKTLQDKAKKDAAKKK